MKNRLLLFWTALWVANNPLYAEKNADTYSCSAVLADKYYVPPGEVIVVNAQVDCFFISGLGSTFGPSESIDIPLKKESIVSIADFAQDSAIRLAQLQHFPTKNELFAFQYKPIKGQFKGQVIQVVIRTEPVTNIFKQILLNQLAQAQSKNNTEEITRLDDLLKDIDSKSIVQIYRRIPSMGQTKFKPMHTKIFAGSPEKEIADIRILPTGNLQIIEHTHDGKKLLVEEAFGKL